MALIVISSIISTTLILFVIYKPLNLANYMNLIDEANQNNNKIHLIDTPKIGGVAIFILSTQIFFSLYLLNIVNKEIVSIYWLIFSFFILGLIDDYINIDPLKRIILFTLASIICLYLSDEILINNIYLELLDKKINTNDFSYIFTIFCFLSLQNSFNFSDGVNGNLLTITFSIMIILVIISFNFILFLFMSTILILLYANLKNYIFLGNNGSSIISACVSVFLILYHKEHPLLLSAEKILILLLLPGIDMIRVAAIRIFNNKSPFIGDTNHFHHIVFRKIKILFWVPSYIFVTLLLFYLSNFINIYLILLFQSLIYYGLLIKYKK